MSISLIIGPMFSGKTTELIRRLTRARIAKKRVLIIGHSSDNRYSKEKKIISHDKRTIECLKTDTLNDSLLESNPDFIGIDEGQFFNNLNIVDTWANRGIHVIIAGLDSDYNKEGFEVLTKLISSAENITKLTAICVDCGHCAHFTKRITESKEKILVGGINTYQPMCRNCFNKK